MGKYLVTGACGFTGSHTVDFLAEHGVDVVATDLESADRRYLRTDVEFIPADLSDKDSLRKVMRGVDYILHTAAIFNFSAPKSLLKKVNVDGMQNLCEVAVENGIKRLVSWSTCGVYGRIKRTPITEDHPKTPVEDYSRSKLQQDNIAKKFLEEKGLPITIVRPGLVYGPRSKYGVALFFIGFNKMIFVPVPINFTFKMAPVHAKDVGAAAYHLSIIPEAVGEEYHVVDNSRVSMTEFLQFTASLLGKTTVPFYAPMSLVNLGAKLGRFVPQELLNKATRGVPMFEKPTFAYFPIDLDVSNEKLVTTGYKFLYPDYRIGIIETVDWMKKEKII